MHPNPVFRKTADERSLDFARSRGFGILAVAAEGAPYLSHVPFLLSEEGAAAELHLVRSNPICRLAGGDAGRGADAGVAARIAVSGPDGYVSPDWYGDPGQVPTLNYVAVHLTGTLHALPQAEMEGMLARQSAQFEERLPKSPWTLDKMDPEAKARMMRMILPFRFEVAEVESTWKLNQNKDPSARLGAAEAVTMGIGSELDALAALMRDPPREEG